MNKKVKLITPLSSPSKSNLLSFAVKSSERVPKDTMNGDVPTNGHVHPGISIRMGPVDDMDVDGPTANGNVTKSHARRIPSDNLTRLRDAKWKSGPKFTGLVSQLRHLRP